MKKLLSLLLVLIMIFSLFSCDSETNSSNTESSSYESESQTDSTEKEIVSFEIGEHGVPIFKTTENDYVFHRVRASDDINLKNFYREIIKDYDSFLTFKDKNLSEKQSVPITSDDFEENFVVAIKRTIYTQEACINRNYGDFKPYLNDKAETDYSLVFEFTTIKGLMMDESEFEIFDLVMIPRSECTVPLEDVILNLNIIEHFYYTNYYTKPSDYYDGTAEENSIKR